MKGPNVSTLAFIKLKLKLILRLLHISAAEAALRAVELCHVIGLFFLFFNTVLLHLG